MQRNRILTGMLALAAITSTNKPALAQAAAPGQSPLPAAPAKTELTNPGLPAQSGIIVPVDTTIPVILKNTISTRTASVGDSIYCETIYPVTVGNRIVIPVGSYVRGSVTQVVRPGHVKGRGQLGLRFDGITLPNGTTHQLRATLSGFGGNGRQGFKKSESKIEGESSKSQDAVLIADTTAGGAETGLIVGAIKGSAGKGLGIGAAAGAAGGVAAVLISRGKEIVLTPGTNLELQLVIPLRLQNDEVDPPSKYDEGPGLSPRGPGLDN